MDPRAAVYDLVSTDPELVDLGVQAVYPANAVDTPKEDLFVILRWETSDARLLGLGRAPGRLTVQAHDTDRDYGRIEKVLARVQLLLESAVHRTGADGVTITQARWNQNGPDLTDEGYGTVTRWSDFSVLGR